MLLCPSKSEKQKANAANKERCKRLICLTAASAAALLHFNHVGSSLPRAAQPLTEWPESSFTGDSALLFLISQWFQTASLSQISSAVFLQCRCVKPL